VNVGEDLHLCRPLAAWLAGLILTRPPGAGDGDQPPSCRLCGREGNGIWRRPPRPGGRRPLDEFSERGGGKKNKKFFLGGAQHLPPRSLNRPPGLWVSGHRVPVQLAFAHRPPGERLWPRLFHCISAYCKRRLRLWGDSSGGLPGNPVVNAVNRLDDRGRRIGYRVTKRPLVEPLQGESASPSCLLHTRLVLRWSPRLVVLRLPWACSFTEPCEPAASGLPSLRVAGNSV